MARYETGSKKVDSPEKNQDTAKSAGNSTNSKKQGLKNGSSSPEKSSIPKPKEKPRPSALNPKDSKSDVQSPKTPIIVSPGELIVSTKLQT